MSAPRRSLLLLLLLAVPAPAADKRPMTVDDLMKVRNVGDPRISPDGERIAYVVSVADFDAAAYNSDLWLVPFKGGDAVQLTRSPKRDDTPRWSSDGKRIGFLSNRGGKVQVWAIDPSGGEAEKLTDSPTDVVTFAWSPDGKRLAYIAPDPESDAEKKRKEAKDEVIVVDRDLKYNRLHALDLATKKAEKLDTGKGHVLDLDWSPDGQRLAFTFRPSPGENDMQNTDVGLTAPGGEFAPLVRRPGADFQPRWSPDGKRVAFLSKNGASDYTATANLSVVTLAGGGLRNLSDAFDETPADMPSPDLGWSSDGSAICFTANDRTARRLYSLSAETGRCDSLTPQHRVHSHVSLSRDGRRAALLVEDPTASAEVHAVEMGKTVEPRRLTSTNPQLAEIALGQVEVVRWKNREDMDIDGLLVKPVGYKEGQRYPLLTYVHGGPASLFRFGFTPYGTSPQAQRYPIQVFAGQGYAVFCPNPRGSTGYGEKFRKANLRDWGGGDLRDILSGIDELDSRGIADPQRLGLMGWSYGGFMTGWTITQTDRFKAASAGAGISSPSGFYGATDIPSFLEHYFGGPPWLNQPAYDRCSAVLHARGVKTPTLIQFGEKDERVQLAQGKELYAALKRNKVPVEMVIYPRQGHVVSEPRLQADVMQRNVDWFKRWIKK